MKLVAFDLETTGTDAQKDRIVEFCFIELDGELKETGRWSRLVDPGMPIPAETTAIHNITNEMVAEQPPFSHHASRIQRLVQDATLIAHNHRFDMQFLHNELQAAGQPGLTPDHPCIDTLQIERNVNSHSLGACYQRYMGESLGDAHRSEADTAGMVDILRRQRIIHAAKLPADLNGLVTSRLHGHFNPHAELRRWLDHGHRFYADNEGVVRFGFGKHRGDAAAEHADYLLWMRDRDFPDDAKRIVEELLGPEYKPSQRTLRVDCRTDGAS